MCNGFTNAGKPKTKGRSAPSLQGSLRSMARVAAPRVSRSLSPVLQDAVALHHGLWSQVLHLGPFPGFLSPDTSSTTMYFSFTPSATSSAICREAFWSVVEMRADPSFMNDPLLHVSRVA